jgi:hypothetical protein
VKLLFFLYFSNVTWSERNILLFSRLGIWYPMEFIQLKLDPRVGYFVLARYFSDDWV